MARTKFVDRDTAPLECYIRKALGPDYKGKIFSASPYLVEPTLVKGQMSRILTFRGSFNPPHQGHLDALCHAFFRGTDLNIIAAIVYPLPIESLVEKSQEEGEDGIPLLLTHDERVTLFNKSGIEGGWHWCFPRHVEEKDDFQRQVEDAADGDGFDIDFVSLIGPDHVSALAPGEVWDANTIVAGTGHPSRTTFRDNPPGLTKVGGYSDWVNLRNNQKLLDALSAGGGDQWIKHKMLMLAPQNYHHLPSSGELSLQAVAKFKKDLCDLLPVRQCRSSSELILRYVPTQPFGKKDKKCAKPDVSSTDIRRIIKKYGLDRALIEKLAGTALAPQCLFDMLQRHRILMEQIRELCSGDHDLQVKIYKEATLSDQVLPRLRERQNRLSHRHDRIQKAFDEAMEFQRKEFDDAKERQRKAWDRELRRRQQANTAKDIFEELNKTRNTLLDEYFEGQEPKMRHRIHSKLMEDVYAVKQERNESNDDAEFDFDKFIEACTTAMSLDLDSIMKACEDVKDARFEQADLLESWERDQEERKRKANERKRKFDVAMDRKREEKQKIEEAITLQQSKIETIKDDIERLKEQRDQIGLFDSSSDQDAHPMDVDDEESQEESQAEDEDGMDVDDEESEEDERPAKRPRLLNPRSEPSSSSSSSSLSSFNRHKQRPLPRHGFGLPKRRGSKHLPKKSTGGKVPRKMLSKYKPTNDFRRR